MGLHQLWDEVRGRRAAHPVADYAPFVPDEDSDETIHADAGGGSAPVWQSEAITGRTFVIAYSDAKGQASERQILCRRIEDNAGVLYLHAYCYVRERVRAFRADRIQAIVDPLTGEVHEPGIALLRLFLPNSTSAAPFRYGLPPRQYGDLNAALNVLAFIARCDGQWHPLEASAIEDFATSYWLRAEIAAPLEPEQVIRHAERLAPDAESFWVSLQRCARNPILSVIIRRHIATVIDADGAHHPLEIFWGQQVDEFLAA